MQTIATIVISAQNGNLQAFSTLLARFQDLAFATAFAMLRNAQLAEDVAQEAFLEVYINLYDETHDAPPIGWAGENGQQEMFDFLLEKGAKITIGQAAAYGELRLVQSLIGQDPTLVHFGTDDPSQGWSPLWEAAYWKRKETVEYLLANGADVNAATRRGEMPLHGAVMGEDRAIVERLLLQGACVNAQASNGMTALHRAAWQRSTEIVALLVAQGAGAQILDNNGRTPLQLAVAAEGTSVAGWGKALAPVAEVVALLQSYISDTTQSVKAPKGQVSK